MNVATRALAIISFSVVCGSVRFTDVEEEIALEGDFLEDRSTSSPEREENSGLDNLRRLIELQAKLQTNTDSTDPTPLNRSKHKILFVTVATQNTKQSHRLQGPPGWDWEIHNIAPGKPLKCHGDINKYLNEWIVDVPDDQFVVFMDGNDVMYGGCDLEEFMQRFQMLSTATKAPIIFGVEYNCFQPPKIDVNEKVYNDKKRCAEYPVRNRDRVLKLIGVNESRIDSWATQDKGGFKFLNSGVHMGKAKYLKLLYRDWYNFSKGRVRNQGGAAQVFYEQPDLVGLDYASLLVSNLFNLRMEQGGQALYNFDKDKKQWMNSVTGKSVCLFHGNGYSGRDYLASIEKTQRKDENE